MENDVHHPLHCRVSIDEAWINRLLQKKDLQLPIHEKYTLCSFLITISGKAILISADLKEKPGTKVEMTILPHWSEDAQRLQIEELKVGTSTRNIFLKSAGWIAQAFLNATIDKKLEEVANDMIRKQLTKLKSRPLNIPAPHGNVTVSVRSLTLHDIFLTPAKLEAVIRIEAGWEVDLH